MILRICLAALVLYTLGGFAQPVVSSAVNAASYLTPPPLGSTPSPAPIAQGSIFVVFGTNMGGPVQATTLPLETSLGGTSISVSGGGQTVAAFMVYAFPTQLAAILPSNTPIGTATLTVTSGGQTSKPINIVVTKAVPGIFTWNAQGFGAGVAQVALSGTDIRLNNLTTPGTPGSVMILYGTGLGPISGTDSAAPGAISTGGTVTVTVGGKQASVLYAGRAPQFPGEDQINIQLPQDVPLGCYTPAVVVVNGIPSNNFVISTAPAQGSCAHPFGLSPQTEAALDAQGAASLISASTATANVGVFAALRGAAFGIQAEGAGGLFGSFNEAQLFNAYNAILSNFHVTYYPAPTGSCIVYDELSLPTSSIPVPNDFTVVGGKELQPGAVLNLAGPGGISQAITRPGSGSPGVGYLWVNLIGTFSPAEIGPGTYTLSGTGGADVAAFSASTEFPQNLVWTNAANFSSSAPVNGVTMTFTAAGTAGQPDVNIFGNSSVFNVADPSKNRGKSFSCIVDASLKQFVVPASVTQQLPVAGSGEVANGSLGISIGGGSPFNATLTNGTKLDGSFFGFGEAFVNNGITWK